MRHLVVIAVLMFVGSMFVSSSANAADPRVRGEVTGWGTSYQYAGADAERQLRKIEDEHPGYYCKVTGFTKGIEPLHDPPCWLTKYFYLKKSKP